MKSHKLQNMNEYFDQMIYDNQKILSIIESIHDNIIKEGDSSLNPSWSTVYDTDPKSASKRHVRINLVPTNMHPKTLQDLKQELLTEISRHDMVCESIKKTKLEIEIANKLTRKFNRQKYKLAVDLTTKIRRRQSLIPNLKTFKRMKARKL